MKIIVISTNAGTHMGGEAIKAYQYFSYLLQQGQDAYLLTHARCCAGLDGHFPPDRLIYVEDDAWQAFFWKSRILRRFVGDCFHLAAARLVKRFAPSGCVLHYLCPISPMIRRHPPKGYRYVIGPLSGNIFHPPAFRSRMARSEKIQQRIYKPLQRLNGVLFKEKKGAHRLLVSGYERTRRALKWSGANEDQMMDVADSGLEESLVKSDLPVHEGVNKQFIFFGRLVEYKGADLAIRAVAQTTPRVNLTIYGKGPMLPGLKQLSADLGLKEYVKFIDWLPHDQIIETAARYRGFIFPTLAEANGIVMQEAMMLGLPVVTLNWGGPQGLANRQESILIDPTNEQTVIADIATAMSDLAQNPERANQLAQAARKRAERHFSWDTVAASWQKAYEGL
ncbi:GDP-mannose-dependent alpha-(1-6)-phosphatidylinositol monomannoside mannosyltransferase [Roseovarius albus]|uniref:GDP-mannose-dependent alpha-(1-6)-phosphatidylinositol monomannoside mannosyltransferase n=1 Tax=Roseovarius albus TaxID=1247867 RepID=A0A1X6YVT1_9RHOB|nr:glycosyltransferase family 4 protein [Roseovarius albus]SLN32578.1 GDP-mannose-dependent alpha-(1-6)-phosphatidylinositol monomannoside mannosyltransferase [Roseovarius albus]